MPAIEPLHSAKRRRRNGGVTARAAARRTNGDRSLSGSRERQESGTHHRQRCLAGRDHVERTGRREQCLPRRLRQRTRDELTGIDRSDCGAQDVREIAAKGGVRFDNFRLGQHFQILPHGQQPTKADARLGGGSQATASAPRPLGNRADLPMLPRK
jgi:hypothetical protein